MKHHRVSAIKWIIPLVICFISNAFALGNSQQGEQKAIVCSACHGPHGLSTNPEWPNLAGQHVGYLIKELHDFKDGKTRNAVIMTPMVATLSDQDIEDLAAFYATQTCVASKSPTNLRGETIYRTGDQSKHITACIACHGPDGTGNAQAGFPFLRGQQPLYTIQQLQAFKSGARHNDLNGIMHDISGHMTDDDMKAVAEYIAALPSLK